MVEFWESLRLAWHEATAQRLLWAGVILALGVVGGWALGALVAWRMSARPQSATRTAADEARLQLTRRLMTLTGVVVAALLALVWLRVRVAALFSGRVWSVIQALIILIVGLAAARLVARGVVQVFTMRAQPQMVMMIRRAVFYLIAGLALVTALRALGFDLSVLLGAAGILTVALGFASQTSASNMISGLFLIGERPFVIGDIIKVGQTSGEVLSIDLLSVKLRTFDNLFVRVPNETLIKSEITNLTHFPIRRFDLAIDVAYREDVKRVRELLFALADQHPLCLEEPRPQLFFMGFGESGQRLQFSVWAARERFLEMRNDLQEKIKATFDEHNIQIPFPHRTLYAGSETSPIPIRLYPMEAPPRQSAGEPVTERPGAGHAAPDAGHAARALQGGGAAPPRRSVWWGTPGSGSTGIRDSSHHRPVPPPQTPRPPARDPRSAAGEDDDEARSSRRGDVDVTRMPDDTT